MKHLGDITKINGAETQNRIYKVYKYTFPDGKIYIGTTGQRIQDRRDCGYQHNKPLTQAMRGVGWKNIKVDILFSSESKEDAFNAEMRFIAQYNSTEPRSGYNISKGGNATFAGLHHTEEHKQNMRAILSGRKFSEKHIANLCHAHAKERKPVICTDQFGEKLTYESLGSAAQSLNCHKSNISRACASGKKYKGFFWTFAKQGGDLG